MRHRRRRFQAARKAYRVSLEKAGASSAWLAARGVVNLPTAVDHAIVDASFVDEYKKVLEAHAHLFSLDDRFWRPHHPAVSK